VAAAAERASSASPPLFALSPPAELLTPTAERTFEPKFVFLMTYVMVKYNT
jgi:hypothetical protein